MGVCPDCGSTLERKRGKDFTKTLPSGIIIKGYDIIWHCPKCKEVKPNCAAELKALGKINTLGRPKR